jgi:hypothetical protein
MKEHLGSIFISYRRDDTADVAGRIYDRLIQHFGEDLIFKDVDSIPLGVNFRKYLSESVGCYTDFNRQFLPRQRVDESRWARVRAALQPGRERAPIEVYQIGRIYFVKDGNHRVSVARELGWTHIAALVTEVHSRVVVTPDLAPDDLIIAGAGRC